MRFWVLVILAVAASDVLGQVGRTEGRGNPNEGGRKSIVDDSTKQVYGPKTVQFTTEYLIKNNFSDLYQNPDTTVFKKEKYTLVDASERRYQSLGFYGSPLFDYQYDLPVHPGRTLGINGYDLYFPSSEGIRYYDTKSPFMDLAVILGGGNRNKINFSFSRNVNPHWNLGFDIYRITADKQVGLEAVTDRQIESVGFILYTHYSNPEKPYQIAFSMNSLKHQVADIGGVDVEPDAATPDFYLYEDSDLKLGDASTLDQRLRFHVYQQYNLTSGFEAYLQSDFTTQKYRFSNSATGSGTENFLDFFPEFNLDSTATSELTDYSDFTLEGGLKGNIRGAFYRFYLKQRSLIYNPKYLLERTASETYAGTYLRFDWKDRFSVTGQGEISNEGAYNLIGSLRSDFAEISYQSQLALPNFLVQNYSGNHHDWSNSFDLTFSNKLSANLDLKWNVFEIRPEVSFMTRSNMIVMDNNQQPLQLPKAIFINRYGATVSMNVFRGLGMLGMHEGEYFRIENRGIVMSDSGEGDEYLRFPNFQYSGRLVWRGDWFQNAVPVELGFDVYFRSDFYANAYDPVLSQFYVQEELGLDAYTSVDFFLNMKIRNLRAYLKWVHINQQPNDGYMVTPYFPGQGSVFDLGIQWLFFD